jgi:hypothetical protein
MLAGRRFPFVHDSISELAGRNKRYFLKMILSVAARYRAVGEYLKPNLPQMRTTAALLI